MDIKTQGWTLIELLVAIAIFTIIVAIAIPSLGQSKKDAKQAKLENDARIYNQAITYARDLKDDQEPCIQTNATDAEAAITYLEQAGYVRGK